MPAYFMSKQTSTPRGMRCNHPLCVSVSLAQTHPLSLSFPLLLSFSAFSLSLSLAPTFRQDQQSFDETGPASKRLGWEESARGGRIINELPPGQR